MEPSEKQTVWEDSFDCDGNCGSSMFLASRNKNLEITVALKALGWLVVSKDEAYCPDCVKTCARITKITKRKRK